jgi:hypothetical protein
MPEEKEKTNEAAGDKELGRIISRREFAIGSIAIIGAYSANELHAGSEADQIKFEETDGVRNLLEDRHITDEDLKPVIQHAEKTGEKLYQPDSDRFLTKLHVKNVYFYAEYSIIEGGYRIHTAYSHRFNLA